MIRTLLIFLFLVLFFIISLPFYALIPVIAKFNARRADRMTQSIVCWAMRVILVLAGVDVELRGRENISVDEPVLYIGNHQSYFDILSTYPYVAGLTAYIAKEEINKVPLIRYWMRLLHGLTFDRDNPRNAMKMILAAIDEIKSGYSIFVFPEGTRSKDGQIGEFKAGSFKIATRTNCPIVPVGISGTPEIFEQHIPAVRPSHVIVRFGEAFRASELDDETKKHIGVYARERVLELIGEE